MTWKQCPGTQRLTSSQVAVYYLPGTFCGCLLGGWLGDRYGRISTIGLGTLWSIFGACLQCSAQNANWMYCGEKGEIVHQTYIWLPR